MIRRRAFLAALCLATLSACAPAGGPRPATPAIAGGGEEWLRSELYFGTSKKDGTTVSSAEFQAFVDEEVTPRFPDGLTILDGYGQYRNRAGRIAKEGAKILVIFHPASAQSEKALDEIRAVYKQRFNQESVLLIRAGARVSF
jgi:hypothetical protein